MYQNKTLTKILNNYHKLTHVEKIIADYFINEHEKVDFSSKMITDKLFVSEASLSRFAKKCGYKGYREFVFSYESHFLLKQQDVSYLTQQVLNSYECLLSQFVHYIDNEQIDRIIQMINDASYVVVIGIGSSGFAAKEFRHRFMRLGVLMDAVDQSDEMRIQAVLQNEKSLMIGLSISGTKEDILFSLEQASMKGAQTLLITSSENDYPYIHEKIVIPSFERLDEGSSISPQYPLLIIIDILYNSFMHSGQNSDNKERTHKQTVDILK